MVSKIYFGFDGITINDFYNGESFAVVFFKIVGSKLPLGFGPALKFVLERAMVKPDKGGNSQHAQDEYAGPAAPAHSVSGSGVFS